MEQQNFSNAEKMLSSKQIWFHLLNRNL